MSRQDGVWAQRIAAVHVEHWARLSVQVDLWLSPGARAERRVLEEELC